MDLRLPPATTDPVRQADRHVDGDDRLRQGLGEGGKGRESGHAAGAGNSRVPDRHDPARLAAIRPSHLHVAQFGYRFHVLGQDV